MIATNSVYAACEALFAQYPLAVSPVGEADDAETIVLMLRGGDSAAFFILVRSCTDDGVSFVLCPWGGDEVFSIRRNDAELPDLAARAVGDSVPLPRSGSMFGWVDQRAISALIAVSPDDAPEPSTPTWSVMPLAGSSPEQWPQIVHEYFFGAWFWDDYRSGRIVSLHGLIAESWETVFWVDTYDRIGSDCLVVEQDVRTADNVVLRRGRYTDFRALLQAAKVPPIEELLADDSKVDLATRFEPFKYQVMEQQRS